MNAHEVAALVPMVRLLETLAFEANEHTRRCACILHGGSNRSAFSWTVAGLWKCHSCGSGGDRIALVRVVRGCSFREAVEFLAGLAGVEFLGEKLSRVEVERRKRRHEQAKRAAWSVRDEILQSMCYYRDSLHRAERLMARMGEGLRRARSEAEADAAWVRMARLAPTQTFFLAGYDFLCRTDAAILVAFALALPAQRRSFILGDHDDNTQLQAA